MVGVNVMPPATLNRMLRRAKQRKDLHLERMFETRSEAWERAGLTV